MWQGEAERGKRLCAYGTLYEDNETFGQISGAGRRPHPNEKRVRGRPSVNSQGGSETPPKQVWFIKDGIFNNCIFLPTSNICQKKAGLQFTQSASIFNPFLKQLRPLASIGKLHRDNRLFPWKFETSTHISTPKRSLWVVD